MNAKKTNVAELLKTGLKSSEGMLVVGFILMCIGFTIVVPVFATPAQSSERNEAVYSVVYVGMRPDAGTSAGRH